MDARIHATRTDRQNRYAARNIRVDIRQSRGPIMSMTYAVVNLSKAVIAGYKILATSILAYYLVKDTRERRRREKTPSKRGGKTPS